MDDHFDRNMLDVLPFGVGCVKWLMDADGKAGSYVFLDINTAFETLTGLCRKDILGQPVSRVLREKMRSSFDWVSYLAGVSHSGKAQETTQWFEAPGRRLHITLAPSDREILVFAVREAAGGIDPAEQSAEDKPPSWNLDAVLRHTHDAISLLEYSNGEFRYILNNAVHQKLTGFSNISGMSLARIVGEEAGKILPQYFDLCMRTGRPVTYEQKFAFAPGERIWQTEVSPMLGRDGETRYLLCSSKDISEQKKMQAENEGLVRRLQSMFNQHGAIMLIFEPVSGRIVDANPAACDFYGYSAEEIRSLVIQNIDMLPAQTFQENCRRMFADQNYFAVVPHRLKSGEIRLVDVYSSPILEGGNIYLYSIIFAATDREGYRNALFYEKEMLKTTLRSIGDGVVTTDNAGLITSLNSVAQQITGWDHTSAAGRPFTDVFVLQNEETGEPVEDPVQKVLTTGRIVGLANHTVLLNRQGLQTPIADSAAPIKTEDGQTFGVVMVFRDVSLEKEHSRQIRFLSYHDSLTGLYNRRYIEETLSHMDSAEHLPLSVIMGDVNGLKITNDVFGHEAGDRLLRHVAGQLEKNCRKGDLIARWGGDEFVVFMPRTKLKEAEKMIARIKRDHIAMDESGLQLSLSLGCSVREALDCDIRSVMREAEENMYHQKLLDGRSYRNAIINTLLATLYEKSMETEEQSKRIEANCHTIGQKLQLPSKEMDELSLLAILHDIGKVGVNPEILKKPASLTSAEWDEMKRHPEIGYRIVQATPELANVAEFILAHHERWDGKGYPRGLKEKEIPLICRILAVTDAYDAMTNDRAYRKARIPQEAVWELERNAGTQFDPEIVSLFIQVLQV